MRHSILATIVMATLITGTAWAQGKDATPPAGGMDMSKMGPWSRKPSNEKQTKKEIAAFFKEEEELMKKGDPQAMLARIDFPVYMLTDDSKGVPKAEEWNKEKYTAVMKPMWENMPKDVKMTHQPSVTVMSDALVNVTDAFTMTVGKNKMSGRNMTVLVKRDGQWKWKVMGEAGWGDMPAPPTAPAAPADAKK